LNNLINLFVISICMKITIIDGLIIKDGKLLLLKKFTKDYYETPGGKLKENESLEDCLKRELKEEIGIGVLEFELFEKLEFSFENKEITDYMFLIKSFSGEIVNNEPEVLEEMVFRDLGSVDNLAPNIEQVKQRLQSI